MEGVRSGLDKIVVLVEELLPVGQLSSSKSKPESFGGISRAYALFSSANSTFSFPFLQEAVCFLQDLRDNMGSIREHESSLVVDSIGIKLFQFVKELRNINYDSVSKDVLAAGVQDSTGQEVEGVLVPISHHGVSRVRSSVEPGANVIVFRQDVYEFPLAFVSPLRAKYDTEFGVESCFAGS